MHATLYEYFKNTDSKALNKSDINRLKMRGVNMCYITWFNEMCKKGNMSIIKSVIDEDLDDLMVGMPQSEHSHMWQHGLTGACEGGHLELAQLMILRGANYWNNGLLYACRGGHLPMVELMISKGADNWDLGLCGACEGGHLSIAELMILWGINNWNDGLAGACEGGHLPMVELMISKGADNWNCGLYYACSGGHLPIVELMISKGADNWDTSIIKACLSGNLDIVILILKHGPKNWCVLRGLERACDFGHVKLVHLLSGLLSTRDLNRALSDADHINLNTIKILINNGADPQFVNEQCIKTLISCQDPLYFLMINNSLLKRVPSWILKQLRLII